MRACVLRVCAGACESVSVHMCENVYMCAHVNVCACARVRECVQVRVCMCRVCVCV